MRCPACSAQVPSTEQTSGLAHCPACNHVFEVADTGSTPDRTSFGQVEIPPGVQRHVSDRSIEIRLPWKDNTVIHHGLWLFVLLPPILVPGLQALLMSGAALIMWVFVQANHTTITVTDQGVTVSDTFPSPLSPQLRLSRDELRGLHLQTQQHKRGYEEINETVDTFYGLATPSTTVLHAWTDPDRITYVLAAIEAVHGAAALKPERPMPVPPPPMGVHVRETPDGLELELPWRAQAGIVLYLLPLVAWMVFGFHPLSLIMSSALIALWLYMVQNTTRVTLRPTEVRIENGPLPTPWEPDVRLRPKEIAALEVVEGKWYGKVIKPRSRWGAAPIYFFNLCTRGRRLMWGWRDPGKLEYVVRCARVYQHEPLPRDPDEPLSLQDRVAAASAGERSR